MSAVELDARWDQFVKRLTECVPSLGDVTIHRGLAVSSATGEDAVLRSLVLMCIEQMAGGLPPSLPMTIGTFGEAFDWIVGRAPEARSSRSSASPAKGVTRLRPVQPDDVPLLYEASLNPGNGYRWRYRGATPSVPAFMEHLHQGVLAQFMVEMIGHNRPVGLVSSYNYSPADQVAYVAFMRVAPGNVGHGTDMLAGLLLLCEHLFRCWPMRQLYAEIPGYNWPKFAGGEGLLFDVVGVSPDRVFHDGRYWNEYTICADAARWREISEVWMPIVHRSFKDNDCLT